MYKTESRKKTKSKEFIIGFVGREKSKEKNMRMRELTNFNEQSHWNQFRIPSTVILGL